jgi:hypothetical protein
METPEPRSANDEQRLAVYGRLLGHSTGLSRGPLADVHQIPPGFHGRDFHTLVTSGLSDRAMEIPQDLGREHARVELILYVAEPRPEHVRLLTTSAGLAFEPGTWLGQGHTIPNGQPPSPLFPGTALCGLLLMPTVLEPDAFLSDHLTIDGDPVNFLWLVPLTRAELDLKIEKGLPALLQRFDDGALSHVLDAGRPSLA